MILFSPNLGSGSQFQHVTRKYKKIDRFFKKFEKIGPKQPFLAKIALKMGFFHLLPAKNPLYHLIFLTQALHTHLNKHKKFFGFLSCEKLAQNTIFQGKITKKSHFQGFFFKIVKNSCLLPEWQRKQSVSRSTKTICSNKTRPDTRQSSH